jgi:large subunit ribosomal protein L24
VRSIERSVPITAAKLIFPLYDPDTATTRDVIVSKVVNRNIFHDRHTGRKRWTRFIANSDIVIPWPKVAPKEQKDHDCDTLRLEVETKTFMPTLLKPPMPSTVIDELRNKYSVFRTRHDEEYIQEKIREDEEKETKKRSVKEMMTPLKERNKAARKMLKAKGKPRLSQEMLARIGEVIARRKALSLPSAEAATEQTV